MMIYQREPVFTIGRAPFVAGAIHVRNQIRVLKQRERARRRKALVERISSLRTGLSRIGGPSRTGVRRDPAPTRWAATANA
jgi:hypothetical protein